MTVLSGVDPMLGENPALVESVIGVLAPQAPGSIAVIYGFTALVSARVAQGILARTGRNARPTPRLIDMSLPVWLAPTTAAALILGLIGSGPMAYAAWNMALPLLATFVLMACAAAHRAVRHLPNGKPVLIGFYGLCCSRRNRT